MFVLSKVVLGRKCRVISYEPQVCLEPWILISSDDYTRSVDV